MLSTIQDIRAFRIPRYKPYLHFLADELHRGIVTHVGQVDCGIAVDVAHYPVMEGFFQPFPGDWLADVLIGGQITFQRGLPCAGMPGRIVFPYIIRKKPVEFLQALDLGDIKAVKPSFFQGTEVPFHLLYECSYKRCYTTDFLSASFLRNIDFTADF